MTVSLFGGHRKWKVSRDKEGHRTYKVTHRVKGSTRDGPANVLQTPGLPLPGSFWLFHDDVDVFAQCKLECTADPEVEDEPNEWWNVENTFSTKPDSRCNEFQFEDPLLEPPKVSGSFVRYTEEAHTDRFGLPITNSAHEQLRGPQVEFDRNRPQVKIEQNVATIDLALNLPSQMIDTVNDSVLWGLPARTIKLSNVSWEKAYHGSCYVYFKRTLEFDIDYDTFDRDLLDDATKVLKGHWGTNGDWILDFIDNAGTIPPDNANPTHFIKAIDTSGNPMRIVLNGLGVPAETTILLGTGTGTAAAGDPGRVHVEKYGESNFLLLGIPIVL